MGILKIWTSFTQGSQIIPVPLNTHSGKSKKENTMILTLIELSGRERLRRIGDTYKLAESIISQLRSCYWSI